MEVKKMQPIDLRLKKGTYPILYMRDGKVAVKERTGEIFSFRDRSFGLSRKKHNEKNRKYDYVLTDLNSGLQILTASRKHDLLEEFLSKEYQRKFWRIIQGEKYQKCVALLKKLNS